MTKRPLSQGYKANKGPFPSHAPPLKRCWLELDEGSYTLGVLVQANYGVRDTLTIAGVPVGREITDLMPENRSDFGRKIQEFGSIIVVVAVETMTGINGNTRHAIQHDRLKELMKKYKCG